MEINSINPSQTCLIYGKDTKFMRHPIKIKLCQGKQNIAQKYYKISISNIRNLKYY
jgi:hypothetical protein